MSQKKIKNYFTPIIRNKINVGDSDITKTENNSNSVKNGCSAEFELQSKKLKVDVKTPNSEENCYKENDPSKAPLTPDLKMKIEINRIKALIKLQCKKSVALHESIGTSWFNVLKEEFDKPYFQELSSFQKSEREKYTIYPPVNQVYSWTNYCDLKDIKVVILGQDPYHGVGQAHGLCFSVQKGIPPPPSLVNMYKELESDIPGFKHPGHGYLVGWARQGVLLLNACLTVRANQANSHKDKGWEAFTDAVIKAVAARNTHVVFLLWGAYAQKKASVIDKKKHYLLHAPHPSPLSAHRGFFGCHHFSKCNDFLAQKGKTPVDWTSLPLE